MEVWADEWWDEELLPSFAYSEEYSLVTRRKLMIVTFSFVFWNAMYSILSRVTNWENATIFRLNSLMHSTLATLVNLWIAYNYGNLLSTPTTFCDILPNANVIWCMSLGYFLYDLYKNIFIHGGIDFIFHGFLVSLVLCFFITHPCGQRPALMNMFLESSTIFMHLYAFLFYAGWLKLAAVFRILFAIVFFLARIALGAVITYETWQAFVIKSIPIEIGCCPPRMQLTGLVLNGVYQVLNWYWFVKILEKVVSVCSGKSKVIDSDKGLDFDKHRNAAITGDSQKKKEA